MITPPSGTIPPAFTGVAEAPTAAKQSAMTTDYNTFLKMLTAQMMNQDPLNPIDSSDYAQQLATFSSVEQQVVTNDLLTSMLSLLGAGGLGDLASWVGREVRSEAPAFFDGAPVWLAVSPAPGAERSVLEVYDDSGNLLQSHELSRQQTSFEWAGMHDDGTPYAQGHYSFLVNNFSQGESIGLTAVASYNPVAEARIDGGRTYLVLEGGHVLTPDDVTGLRA